MIQELLPLSAVGMHPKRFAFRSSFAHVMSIQIIQRSKFAMFDKFWQPFMSVWGCLHPAAFGFFKGPLSGLCRIWMIGEKIPISLMTRMRIFSLLEAEILSFGTDWSKFIQIQLIKTACRKNYSDLWGFPPFISFPIDFCVLSHSCATGWQAPAWMPNRFPANPEIQSWDGATLEPCLS